MNTDGIEYTIVVPAYKSGAWMDELVARIGAVMEPEAPGAFELLLVNDCSPDAETWPAIRRNAEAYAWVRGFNLLYNVGQFKATLCGMEQARGRFILTMDDDLQHLPEEIPVLIRAMREHPSIDCVMGQYIGKKHGLVRNAGSRMVQRILNRLYNKPADIVTTSFRIMPAAFAKSLLLYRIASPQLGPLIVSITKQIMNVPVRHESRKSGGSGYGWVRCLQEASHSVINASIVPLRLFSILGFATAALAFVAALGYFIRWALGGIGMAGFTSLILAIMYFSGMILAGIGVLGEYIGRIIQELTGMPRYHIRDRAESRQPDGEP
jgi:polyisoprenyl-phosphate glycosyltransferase